MGHRRGHCALREAGWTVTIDGVQNNIASPEQTTDGVSAGTGHRIEITADKGGAPLRFDADVADAVAGSQYSDTVVISAWPTDTGALLPFSTAGAALGALIGWATGAGITRRRPPPAATVTAGLAITALALPAYAIYVRLALAVRNPAHPGTPTTDLHKVLLHGNGFWENPMSQSWLLPGVSLAGAALPRTGRSTCRSLTGRSPRGCSCAARSVSRSTGSTLRRPVPGCWSTSPTPPTPASPNVSGVAT